MMRDVCELLLGVVLFGAVLAIGFYGFLWVRSVAPDYERGFIPEEARHVETPCSDHQ